MSIPRNLSIIADTLNSDGTFASISNTGSTTLSSGTANGVAYLNGSKVLTTGSALTFDGANLGVGVTPSASSLSNYRIIEVAYAGNGILSGLNDVILTSNAYFNSGYKYGASNFASLYNQNNGQHFWKTAPSGTAGNAITFTQVMTLDASGNLGIGTTSPAYKLVVSAAGASGIEFGPAFSGTANLIQSYSRSGGVYVDTVYEAAQHRFNIAGSEKARIDSSGNVGIGTTSPNRKLVVSNAGAQGFEFGAGVGTGSGNEVLNYNRSTSLYIQKTEYASSYTFVTGTAGNVTAATIDSSGNVGIGTSSPVVKLHVATSGNTPIINETTGGVTSYFNLRNTGGQAYIAANNNALVFAVTASATEAARIDSSGNLLVGTTSGITSGGVVIQPVSGQSTIYIGHITGTGSGASYSEFYYAGTKIGSITQSGTTAVLFNVTSDQRLKENIQDAESASALIDSLQVRQFDWKTDNSHQRYGFIAQELVTVAPEAVHQPADPDEMMAVDYSKLVPMLVKEIQLLRKRLAALEST